MVSISLTENCPQTYTERNRDHPSMLGALGFLPADTADADTMRRTLQKTLKEWQWNETWGWDYPLTALTTGPGGEIGRRCAADGHGEESLLVKWT